MNGLEPNLESRLLLVRHAETQANASGVFHGSLESPLTRCGRKQARLLAAHLQALPEPPRTLYSSPSGRALATSRPIADALSLTPRVRQDLRECDLGDWEGLPVSVLRDRYELWDNARADADYAPHGGDSPRALGERVAVGTREIALIHPSQIVVIVSHGGALCAALARLVGTLPLLGEEYSMDNCAVSSLLFGANPRLLDFNNRQHLGPLVLQGER